MPKNPSSTNSRNKILKSGTEQLNQPITRTEEEEDRGRYESRHNKKKKAQMPWSIDHNCFNQQTSSNDFSSNIEKWTPAVLQKAMNLQIGLHSSRILRQSYRNHKLQTDLHPSRV